ncbi:MAG: class I SAM-dependent methyltransferase [Selenomonadaceae bacterium]|nr:class I SAM-dependent methyltransferase [Selenomonadaceae bacterium]
MRKTFKAYQLVGNFAKLFDRMMTNADLPARLALKFFWGLDSAAHEKFLAQAFAGIPKNFCGRLLEVPVGTGVLSLPVYQNLPNAEIFCVDLSDKMLAAAKSRAVKMNLRDVKFLLGDVTNLPFADESFDVVLSVNGFHAFPDKISAHEEVFRVLKRGGTFCGSVYVTGENRRTDLFVENFCERHGFFSPPYETLPTLEKFLSEKYSRAEVTHVESFAGFTCIK